MRDTGPGIPPECLEQVFDPFFESQRRGRLPKGWAWVIDRSDVRGAARRDDRSAESRTGAGRGASFTIPLRPTIAVPRGSASAEAPRILVVDDDPDIRQLLRIVCGPGGILSSRRPTALRALEAVRAETFGGMILDIGIPSIDGMEVLRQIRHMGSANPDHHGHGVRSQRVGHSRDQHGRTGLSC